MGPLLINLRTGIFKVNQNYSLSQAVCSFLPFYKSVQYLKFYRITEGLRFLAEVHSLHLEEVDVRRKGSQQVQDVVAAVVADDTYRRNHDALNTNRIKLARQ